MGTGFDVELNQDEVGIIPRAIHHLFNGITDRTASAKENGVPAPEFKVVCQFLELYNEEIIDLFNPSEHFCNKVVLWQCLLGTQLKHLYFLKVFFFLLYNLEQEGY